MAGDAPRIVDLAEIEAAVRYLEAVQDAAVRANTTAGRLFVLRVVVTLILLAIAADAAETGKSFDLLGFEVDPEPWAVLVTGAVVVSVMQFIDVPYYERGHQLGLKAVRLYRRLGYRTPLQDWRTRENPLRLHYAAAVTNDPLLAKLMSYDGASLGGQILGWMLLLVTQLAVFDELRDLGHDGFWLYAFLLLPLTTLVMGAVRYVLIFHAHRRDEQLLREEARA